jgi:hypothetical protein
MGTGPDWNYYRKLINRLRGAGLREEADAVRALVRVSVAVEKGDFAQAVHRLHTDAPQKVVRGDGNL